MFICNRYLSFFFIPNLVPKATFSMVIVYTIRTYFLMPCLHDVLYIYIYICSYLYIHIYTYIHVFDYYILYSSQMAVKNNIFCRLNWHCPQYTVGIYFSVIKVGGSATPFKFTKQVSTHRRGAIFVSLKWNRQKISNFELTEMQSRHIIQSFFKSSIIMVRKNLQEKWTWYEKKFLYTVVHKYINTSKM